MKLGNLLLGSLAKDTALASVETHAQVKSHDMGLK
jgi:hypothetical protein